MSKKSTLVQVTLLSDLSRGHLIWMANKRQRLRCRSLTLHMRPLIGPACYQDSFVGKMTLPLLLSVVIPLKKPSGTRPSAPPR